MAEEDLGEIFDKIDAGVTIVKNRKISFANDYLLQITGYSLKEIQGQSFVFLAATEEKNRLKMIRSENDKMNSYPKEIEFWEEEINIPGNRFTVNQWKSADFNLVAPFDIIDKSMYNMGYSLIKKDITENTEYEPKDNVWIARWEKK